MTEEEYLKARVEPQIKWYSKESATAKAYYQMLKVAEIIIAATLPFFIGQIKDGSNLEIVTGIMSITIAVIAGLLLAFKFNEKRIQYRNTCENLKNEQYLFLTRSGMYRNPDAFRLFVEKIEFIIAKETSEWAQLVIAAGSKTNNGPDASPAKKDK